MTVNSYYNVGGYRNYLVFRTLHNFKSNYKWCVFSLLNDQNLMQIT